MTARSLIVRSLGLMPYEQTWQAMQDFNTRHPQGENDEFWLVEHPPVFTLGRAGKPEHVLDAGEIPLIQTDRGGQVTYHGPGQIVLYLMVNLKQAKIGIRDMVTAMENSIIAVLDKLSINSQARKDAPGVYVSGEKIAALGLRVKQGCSYHGLSLNYKMDLSPFQRINPCGYEGMKVTQIRQFAETDKHDIEKMLVHELAQTLAYEEVDWLDRIPHLQGTGA